MNAAAAAALEGTATISCRDKLFAHAATTAVRHNYSDARNLAGHEPPARRSNRNETQEVYVFVQVCMGVCVCV